MFKELDGDQIRTTIDTTQLYEGWRQANHDFRHSYPGRMYYLKIGGQEYLYRRIGDESRSLGRRSPETDRVKEDYQAQRRRLRERRKRLADNTEKRSKINRAHSLGRVPRTAARILRKLDDHRLLGENLFVVGTHSLYAYEAAAGVHIDTALVATTDIDLLWDVRRRLRLALLDAPEEGVMGVLRKVDKSFKKTGSKFRAQNDDGYLVDLIRPMEADEAAAEHRGIGGDVDLEAVAIRGLQWLMNAPRFEQIAIGDDCRPVFISCVDPRAFALYKHWLATDVPDREPKKRRRDLQQARVAALLASKNLGLKFSAKDLSALPLRLTQHAKKLASAATK